MLQTSNILENYKKIYGERKFGKVSHDISNSKYTIGFIRQSVASAMIPNQDDFVSCISSNLKYTFSKGDTLLAASLILFTEWAETYTILHDNIDSNILRQVEIRIIERVERMTFQGNISIL